MQQPVSQLTLDQVIRIAKFGLDQRVQQALEALLVTEQAGTEIAKALEAVQAKRREISTAFSNVLGATNALEQRQADNKGQRSRVLQDLDALLRQLAEEESDQARGVVLSLVNGQQERKPGYPDLPRDSRGRWRSSLPTRSPI